MNKIFRLAILYIFFSFSFFSFAGPSDVIANDLKTLYAKYPSLRTNLSYQAMYKPAVQVLGKARATNLLKYMQSHLLEFQALRSETINFLIASSNYMGKAVVSGQSVSGMIAAAILAKSGYKVDVYEMRDEYTRNIQWAGRQALVDQLAAIDQELADKFLKDVAKPLENGSIHISSDGSRTFYDQNILRESDPTKIPSSGYTLMNAPSVINMEAKVFEDTLKEYLAGLPNVKRHNGRMVLLEADEQGFYGVEGHGKLDLIVLAEGSGGKSKDILKIETVSTSPKRLQMAGVVHIEGGGVMAKHWRAEDSDILVTGTMARKGAGKTWVVADIDEQKILPQAIFGTDMSSEDYKMERQRLIDQEFRRLASEAMEVPLDLVNQAKIEGVIKGKEVGAFYLEQKISSKASAGINLITFGDLVGNNHWSVGGGMQVGAVAHGERLKTLLFQMDVGKSEEDMRFALSEYSLGVLEDTRAWGEIGMKDFYPNLSGDDAKKLYNLSIESWKSKKVSSPLEAQKLMMPEGYMSSNIKLIYPYCDQFMIAN
ncbi:MAG: hypothetical protein ACOYL6_08915 [Bacteriovoracaceae bacterium]